VRAIVVGIVAAVIDPVGVIAGRTTRVSIKQDGDEVTFTVEPGSSL
jgi:hypothetical protein